MRYAIERCLLLDLLKDRGLTQAEFARRMEVPRQTVTKWIKLQNIMELETVYRASRVLNCSMDAFYKWSEKVADK